MTELALSFYLGWEDISQLQIPSLNYFPTLNSLPCPKRYRAFLFVEGHNRHKTSHQPETVSLSLYKDSNLESLTMKSDDQVDVSDKSSSPTYDHDKGAAPYVSSDTDLGDVEAVETTKRGLKARHAQMIALGGTIGELSRFPEINYF
jgi:hypothetical protein